MTLLTGSTVAKPGDPWRGREHFIRTCGALGFLRESTSEHAYALLDVLDEDGEVLATYDSPPARAFRFIYRKLHLRVAKSPAFESGKEPLMASDHPQAE